jgi:hypothetical protein
VVPFKIETAESFAAEPLGAT